MKSIEFWHAGAVGCAAYAGGAVLLGAWADAFSVALGGLVFFYLASRSKNSDFFG
jgi:hypothetical protein